jgi:hypothetical protein
MSHHIFGDENGDEFLAIMYRESHPNKFGDNGRSSRPRLDDLSITRIFGSEYLLKYMTINEWPFFQRARHLFLLFMFCITALSVATWGKDFQPTSVLLSPAYYQFVTGFGLPRAVPFRGNSPWRARMSSS